jgi:PAS domain S-box-containing protein
MSADFAAMAENLPEMAWIANPQGRIVWANRRWREYIGSERGPLGADRWTEIHDPDYLPMVAERWNRALKTGEHIEMSFPLRRADGVFRMFLTRAQPLHDAAGNVTCWFGINTDISPLEDATRALEDQRRLLETLNRTAARIAAELNLEALVQTVTDVAVEITGAKFGAFFYQAPQPTGDAMMLYTISGVPREAFSSFPMVRETAVFKPTLRGEGIVRSDDITADPRYGNNAPYKGIPDGHLPLKSYLAAPVVSRRGEVMGGLFFGHPQPARFTADHEALVSGLAAQAAAGIDNARLYESAQREIAERKQAEEDRLILLRELNHRVKNLFAITAGMVSMTARASRTPQEMAAALNGRLRALAAAHELIRPAITSDNQQAVDTTVGALIGRVLAPHMSNHATQLHMQGPDVAIGPHGATSLALIMHELATNAAKYGALSNPAGQVALNWRTLDGEMHLDWVEQGGPTLSGAPAHTGFGTELARMSARGQLGGDISLAWNPGGAEIALKASLERLAA